MNPEPVRSVFDCMVFLQGAGRRGGPSRRCLELVDAGRVTLCLSPDVLMEIADVLARPVIRQKFPRLRDEDAELLLHAVRSKAELFTNVPNILQLPRDRGDEIYVDLAVAAKARFLVTWNDRHLTYLMRGDTPEGKTWRGRFPDITILNPVEFLREIEKAQE